MTELEQLRAEIAELRAEVRGPETKPRPPLQVFCLFFLVQCLSYGMLCWNYRAVAQARFVSIFVSDLACAFIGFSLIKYVAGTKSGVARAGYVLGGAIGSVISVYITKVIFGQ